MGVTLSLRERDALCSDEHHGKTISSPEFEERPTDLCATAEGASFPRLQRDRHILLCSVIQSMDALYEQKFSNRTVWESLVASPNAVPYSISISDTGTSDCGPQPNNRF